MDVHGHEIKPGAALRKVHLSGADLSGADLSGADLYGAYLGKADLSEVDFSGANLSRAYLVKANLSGANLSGANLHKAWLDKSNLSGADLSGADLSGARSWGSALFFGAKADSATIWWNGFNPDAVGVVFASSESSSPETKSSADSMNTDRVRQSSSADPLDQLEKLGELHAAGALSDEEFAAKKAELLDRI